MKFLLIGRSEIRQRIQDILTHDERFAKPEEVVEVSSIAEALELANLNRIDNDFEFIIVDKLNLRSAETRTVETFSRDAHLLYLMDEYLENGENEEGNFSNQLYRPFTATKIAFKLRQLAPALLKRRHIV